MIQEPNVWIFGIFFKGYCITISYIQDSLGFEIPQQDPYHSFVSIRLHSIVVIDDTQKDERMDDYD